MRLSFPIHVWGGVLLAGGLAVQSLWAAEPAEAPIAKARRLFQEGKYAEAEDAYQAVAGEQPASAALGLARCQEAVGQREKAIETLTAAVKSHPDESALPAELARLALARGDYASAEASAAAAVTLDPNQLLAHWVRAELLTAAGKLDQANAAYQKLVNYFNEHEVKEVEKLEWIGLAAAQYARWNRLGDQFSFLVNDFYPDLLAADPAFWRAHYEAGRLFAEKYNEADASKEFKAALALNPNAAEVHAALGELALSGFEVAAAQAACERALEINPQLLAAMHLKADIHLANFEPRQAIGVLNDALKLQPSSEATLGRLAAACAAVDGLSRTSAETRFGKLADEVTRRNPHAGVFFESVADALDRLRRWPAAAEYYQEAMTRMPQLVAPAGKLGMMAMRLGEEERAKQVLDEAFKADPFNVRVANTLKVLEVLDAYETFETEHFRIKFDPEKDKIIARYMGRWLEEVYPQLCSQMGFSPPGKSLFEVFSRAKNTNGHGWFSARMVGLPHIHPIGACAGKIVALQSPSEGPQRFNWARVLKHEFIHVINLQQTHFNIPHWFTEAVAVFNEGYPRPQSWNELLREKFARGKLMDLVNINLGFIRPQSSDDWNLAYCQAELYAEYMLAKHGQDAIAKMLTAYADNLTTPEAIERSFGVGQADFERGYRDYVAKIVAELPSGAKESESDLATVQKGLAKNPNDANLLARLAQAQLARKNYAGARRSADAALAVDPRSGLAHYVRARLHLLVGENKEALDRLEGAFDREHPQENLLGLLAGLRLKAENYPAAAELYELGATHDPANLKWLKSLAAVYLKSGDNERLGGVLTKLAAADADDLPVRKKLAHLALAQGDRAAAARWALDTLHIDVMDPDLHRWRAEALGAQSAAAAAEEYEVAVELDPDDVKSRFALAQMYVAASQPGPAKHALEELLKRDSKYPGAAELLESLK
ncbi:MAG TPA: tetratricopeptide repeat protein [Pirellulales bacterium]|nr:tetratricopeptide repeat protein [Pirellulales bacterium]